MVRILGQNSPPTRSSSHGPIGFCGGNASVACGASPLVSPPRASTPLNRLVPTHVRRDAAVTACFTATPVTPVSAKTHGGPVLVASCSRGLAIDSRFSPQKSTRVAYPSPLPGRGVPFQSVFASGVRRTLSDAFATCRTRSTSPDKQNRGVVFQKSAIVSPPMVFRHASSCRGVAAGVLPHCETGDAHRRLVSNACANDIVKTVPDSIPVVKANLSIGGTEIIAASGCAGLSPNSDVSSLADVGIDVTPWLNAARGFVMNTDFEVSFSQQSVSAAAADDCRKGSSDFLDFADVMAAMKEQSAGKRTIQALSDKLLLHRMLDNLGVPQLPLLLAVEGPTRPSSQEVEKFVTSHFSSETATDVVVKPAHLSNATGVLVVSRPPPEETPSVIEYLSSHMAKVMDQRANAQESEALRSLRPGFLIQPRYQSAIGFESPLELRVLCLWGQARVAIWWWGRESDVLGAHPGRNVWLVRSPAIPGQLSSDDEWKVAHRHTGTNVGFDRALEIFSRHIPAIAATAEAVATAFGAPFLRSDFFVGSSRWGARLNEVAYGCGCDYCSIAADGSGRAVDDSRAVARIIQEGLAICERRQPPETFLSKLGANGATYEELASGGSVASLPSWERPPLPSGALLPDGDPSCDEIEIPKELCSTVRGASVVCAEPATNVPACKCSGAECPTQVLVDKQRNSNATFVVHRERSVATTPSGTSGASLLALPRRPGPQGCGSVAFSPPQRYHTPLGGVRECAGTAALPQRAAQLQCASAFHPTVILASPRCDASPAASPPLKFRSVMSSPVAHGRKFTGSMMSPCASMSSAGVGVRVLPSRALSPTPLRTAIPLVALTPGHAWSSPVLQARAPAAGQCTRMAGRTGCVQYAVAPSYLCRNVTLAAAPRAVCCA